MFIQRDTYAGDPNDPLSLHKYLYGDANPVMGFDPSGHDDLISLLGGALTSAGMYAQQLGADSIATGMTIDVAAMVTYVSAEAEYAVGVMYGDQGWMQEAAQYELASMKMLYVGNNLMLAGFGMSLLGSALTTGGILLLALAPETGGNAASSAPVSFGTIQQMNDQLSSLDCQIQSYLRQAANFQDPVLKDKYWQLAMQLTQEAEQLDAEIIANGGTPR
jgi:hypothetical protein